MKHSQYSEINKCVKLRVEYLINGNKKLDTHKKAHYFIFVHD